MLIKLITFAYFICDFMLRNHYFVVCISLMSFHLAKSFVSLTFCKFWYYSNFFIANSDFILRNHYHVVCIFLW